MSIDHQSIPTVAGWRIAALRILYALIAIGLSSFVWQQLFFESADWPLMRGIAKSMMGALVFLCLLGLRYPLQMLPVLFFEMLWKTIWLLVIAMPAAFNDRWTSDIESVFYESIGIVIAYAIMPWRYIWARYIKQLGEPWRASSS
ncbi:hypothetical protein [Qipengyuania sp. DGS5-3]|uniref:hypothetical protein n=1 Tax=Qipengyuania sp. DGS5-3 TaxID=3349632 RepID=UPI0036D26FF4